MKIRKKYLVVSAVAVLLSCYSPSIFAKEKSANYWKEGLLVGLIPGAVGGSIGAYYYTKIFDQCYDGPCQKPLTRNTLGVAIGIGGTLLTGAIGAGIGALIPRKDKALTIIPSIGPDGRSASLMLQKSF